VEVQWNNIKKCVLDTMSDLVGKVERRARKSWVTQEMISKMDERRKWKNVNNEEGRNKLYAICTVHFLDYKKLCSDRCTLFIVCYLIQFILTQLATFCLPNIYILMITVRL
jgi:hypothetical protein